MAADVNPMVLYADKEECKQINDKKMRRWCPQRVKQEEEAVPNAVANYVNFVRRVRTTLREVSTVCTW